MVVLLRWWCGLRAARRNAPPRQPLQTRRVLEPQPILNTSQRPHRTPPSTHIKRTECAWGCRLDGGRPIARRGSRDEERARWCLWLACATTMRREEKDRNEVASVWTEMTRNKTCARATALRSCSLSTMMGARFAWTPHRGVLRALPITACWHSAPARSTMLRRRTARIRCCTPAKCSASATHSRRTAVSHQSPSRRCAYHPSSRVR
jgi:hypothetical protein